MVAVAICGTASAARLSRRMVLGHTCLALSARPASCLAAQRGAEDPYAVQMFDQNAVCTERTPLGACKQSVTPTRSVPSQPPAPLTTLKPAAEPESELVTRLLERSAQNKEANDRLVKEKTLKAGLSGSYGPFATTTPVMRTDGSFDSISFARYDRLKDKGKIVKTKTGLDAYAPDFDPDAPEPKPAKLFGLF